MAETNGIGTTQPESGTRTTSSLGEGIERAMAEAEEGLAALVKRLGSAAQGSAAFAAAEKDARRVLGWLRAKARELEAELEGVARGTRDDLKRAAYTLVLRKDRVELPKAAVVAIEPEGKRAEGLGRRDAPGA